MICGVDKILNRHDCCCVPDFALQDDISFVVSMDCHALVPRARNDALFCAFFPRHCEGVRWTTEAIQSTRVACFYGLPCSLRSLSWITGARKKRGFCSHGHLLRIVPARIRLLYSITFFSIPLSTNDTGDFTIRRSFATISLLLSCLSSFIPLLYYLTSLYLCELNFSLNFFILWLEKFFQAK